MKDVNTENFQAEVEGAHGLVVIDLFATWCQPCRMLAPVIEELEGEYPEVHFCRVDVDASPDIAAQFGVRSIPTVAFVKDGTFLDFTVGVVPREKLAAMIEQYR